MRHVAWRLVLPAVQLVVFLVSLGVGCPYLRWWESTLLSHQPSGPEPVFYPAWIDGPPTALEQLAYGLSFPATVAADAVGGVLLPLAPELSRTGMSTELTRHALAALAIVPFWYFLGWCFDRRGMVRHGPQSWPARVALAGVFVLCVELVVIAVLSFLLFKPSTWIEFALGRFFAILWAVLGLLVVRDFFVAAAPALKKPNRS